MAQLDVTKTAWRYVSASAVEDNNSTLEIEAKYSGEDMLAVLKSPLLPMIGSTLPNDPAYVLRERNIEPIGNTSEPEGKRQFLAKLSYRRSTTSTGATSVDADSNGFIRPWKLGAQEFLVSSEMEQTAITQGYNGADRIVPLTNTAGSPYEMSGTRYYMRISFEYCVKGSVTINRYPILNKQKVRVAGISIPKFCGKLLPMSARHIIEYDEEGDVRASYWRVSAEILITEHKHYIPDAKTGKSVTDAWAIPLLNVGTMAVFIPGGKPEPIYRFYKWTSKNDITLLSTPHYGSAADALEAKRRFIDSLTEAEKRNPPDFPITEVTEPMPLDVNGFLDHDALNGISETMKCVFWLDPAESWNDYNLPKEL